MRKQVALIAALFALMLVPLKAGAICTSALVTTSSTQIVAANFSQSGNGGRGPLFQFTGGSSCPVYCDMDVTSATAFAGYPIPAAATVLIPATQHSAKTNPIVPSGAVYCIVPSNMSCSSQTVSVCSF